ncbi:MAG TPA: hypothetical protein VL728_11475 [Cyclobacteriaceae bacterium]|jgi:hypothetical protein|nr:hypothetical protein [Cyclobacteriaceae bacterium]
MKRFAAVVLFLWSVTLLAQKDIKPSGEFVISGQMVHELKFSLADLEKLPSKKIEDIVITNHLGEPRGAAKNLKAVPLKTILDKIEFKAESPKVMSEFYLTFVATDNYKVVYSWNEIFNSATGDNIYLIVEKEGKKLTEMTERILVITSSDQKTGRRNIKGLSKIVVSRVE